MDCLEGYCYKMRQDNVAIILLFVMDFKGEYSLHKTI